MKTAINITISFDPAIQAELNAEASARAISCEQVIFEAVEDYLRRAKSPPGEYDEWFKTCYNEGKSAFEQGNVCSRQEVRQDRMERREKYLKLLSRD